MRRQQVSKGVRMRWSLLGIFLVLVSTLGIAVPWWHESEREIVVGVDPAANGDDEQDEV